jgi:hypothetical protein
LHNCFFNLEGNLKMKKKIALVAMAAAAVCAQAADWSDTSIGLAHGNKFAEPYEGNNISKNIINLTHASGYKYGTNFFNVDMLMSNGQDAAYWDATANAYSKAAAQEVYVIYRNTLDLGKVTGKDFKMAGVRGFGFTSGIDFNSKADNGNNSKKQMVVAGPTVMLDVPAGFFNVSLLQLWESNSSFGWTTNHTATTGTDRVYYTPHPELSASWDIPFTAGVPLAFEGVANFIASKGTLNDGNQSKAETFIDLRLMYDISSSVGSAPKTFKVGAEYQLWKNKFGTDYTSFYGQGSYAKTPMVRAEYHF